MHIKGQVSSEGDKCGFSVMFKNVTALILMQKLGYGELGEEHFEKMRFYISVLYFKVAVNWRWFGPFLAWKQRFVWWIIDVRRNPSQGALPGQRCPPKGCEQLIAGIKNLISQAFPQRWRHSWSPLHSASRDCKHSHPRSLQFSRMLFSEKAGICNSRCVCVTAHHFSYIHVSKWIGEPMWNCNTACEPHPLETLSDHNTVVY